MTFDRLIARWIPMLLLAFVPACTDATFMSAFASLGGTGPGGRGTLNVIFDNQTPYHAIFTVGVYDPLDQNSNPTYVQFAVDADEDATTFNRRLAAGSSTRRNTFAVSCGRVISFGGQEMIDRIRAEDVAPANGAPTIEAAFRSGIYFTDKPLDDPDPNAEEPDSWVIQAAPRILQLGPDYQCDALIVCHLMLDAGQPDGITITVETIGTASEQPPQEE